MVPGFKMEDSPEWLQMRAGGEEVEGGQEGIRGGSFLVHLWSQTLGKV